MQIYSKSETTTMFKPPSFIYKINRILLEQDLDLDLDLDDEGIGEEPLGDEEAELDLPEAGESADRYEEYSAVTRPKFTLGMFCAQMQGLINKFPEIAGSVPEGDKREMMLEIQERMQEIIAALKDNFPELL